MSSSTNPPSAFSELLESQVIVFDGAMGTMLYSKGIPFSQCFDALNLAQPELVRSIHAAYVAAGSHVIETNTFGANRIRLRDANQHGQVRAINRAGVRLAKEAASDKALVAGSIGSLGKHLTPIGNLILEEAEQAYREQGEALAAAGADLLVLETITNLDEMVVALRAVNDFGIPVVGLMTFNEEAKTLIGNKPQEVAQVLTAEGVAALGANCSVGPQGILEVLEKMVPYAGVPVVAMPNAGLPSLVQGRYIYLSSPDYVADFARRAADLGVAGVGGCCGTTPEHIKAISEAVAGLRPARPAKHQQATVSEPVAKPAVAPETDDLSGFYKMLGKRFAISVEIDPPRGVNVERFVNSAIYLKAKGANAINVADSPLARPRMNPGAFCHIIQRKARIETILHMSCRDKNILAIQSELMGAHALGIRTVIAITGDPVQVGGYLQATDVFDLDSVALTRLISTLNQGKDLAGKATDEPTSFRICVAANPTAVDLDAEIEKLWRKIEAGAHFIFTQPVFDPGTLENFLKRVPDLPIPFCLGILPLRSARHAEFIHNEIPGMMVPEQIRRRMYQAGDRGMEEGIAIASETLLEAKPMCQGAYLMPPFNKFEMAGEILEVVAER